MRRKCAHYMWQPPIYKTGFVRSVCARHLCILPFNIYPFHLNTNEKRNNNNIQSVAVICDLWIVIIHCDRLYVYLNKQWFCDVRFFIFQNLWFDIRTHLYQLSIAIGTVSTNTQFIHTPKFYRNIWKKKRNNSERRSFAYCERQWMSMRWKWQTNSQTKASALFTQRVRDFVFVLVLRILHYFLFC